jgi:putative cell wall-binding protein
MRHPFSVTRTERLCVPNRLRRTSAVAIAVAVVLGASVLLPLSAQASPTDDPSAGDSRQVMGDYPEAAYADQAAALPADLTGAIEQDLGESASSYLAGADAAANAVAVVDDLTDDGVEVLGSRLEGTELVVNVASGAEAAAVRAANATAEIGEPAPFDVNAQDFELLGDLVGGQGYYSVDSQYEYRCSVAFNGIDLTSLQNQFLTAGHCREAGTFDNGLVREMLQSRPDVPRSGVGAVLGQPIDSTFSLGNELDSGLVATDPGWSPVPRVGTWNSNNGPVTAGAQQPVRDYARAIVGQSLCKSGRTTGWTCGTVQAVDQLVTVNDGGVEKQINSYISSMCALPGDSGGAVISGGYAIGVLSTGSFTSCSQTGKFTGVFPMTAPADYGSVLGSQPNWELSVAVSPPVPAASAAAGALAKGSSLTGTVPGGTSRYTVTATIDGATTTAPVQPDGSWSIDLSALPAGPHSYSLFASYGSGASTSSTVSGSFTISAVDRISGADRFDVAVQVAEREFPAPATAPVVYVATGMNYPDALSAGPAAVKEGGPLLLVTRDTVPAAVASAITRLEPQRIVIVGGVNSVSTAVEKQLGALIGGVSVERLAGADRYEASRAVVDAAFGSLPNPVEHAYAATGGNFPDALSAGGAAGSAGEPVVLVNGGADTADAATLDLFRTLGTTSITVVGGVNSVREGVRTSLTTVPASVDRVAGADRFEAAVNLNKSAFAAAPTVYLATGFNFPDALAGGVLAGMTDAPLYVVPTECVPRAVLAELQRLGTMHVTLLGGPNSLSPAVENLTACAW